MYIYPFWELRILISYNPPGLYGEWLYSPSWRFIFLRGCHNKLAHGFEPSGLQDWHLRPTQAWVMGDHPPKIWLMCGRGELTIFFNLKQHPLLITLFPFLLLFFPTYIPCGRVNVSALARYRILLCSTVTERIPIVYLGLSGS